MALSIGGEPARPDPRSWQWPFRIAVEVAHLHPEQVREQEQVARRRAEQPVLAIVDLSGEPADLLSDLVLRQTQFSRLARIRSPIRYRPGSGADFDPSSRQ